MQRVLLVNEPTAVRRQGLTVAIQKAVARFEISFVSQSEAWTLFAVDKSLQPGIYRLLINHDIYCLFKVE